MSLLAAHGTQRRNELPVSSWAKPIIQRDSADTIQFILDMTSAVSSYCLWSSLNSPPTAPIATETKGDLSPIAEENRVSDRKAEQPVIIVISWRERRDSNS
jgi:hypothetical protein